MITITRRLNVVGLPALEKARSNLHRGLESRHSRGYQSLNSKFPFPAGSFTAAG
jgi:hypothetical protein